MFKLAGTVEQATIHLVNLPKGAKVGSPNDAHQGQTDYQISNENADIIGFFSTEHKAVFTHHDTFLHLHLITADRKKMGHLDKVMFKKGTVKLFLPSQ
jgi:acetolactate decarboxylase